MITHFSFFLAPVDCGAARRAVGAGLWQHWGAEEHVPTHRRGAGGAGSVSMSQGAKGPPGVELAAAQLGVLTDTPVASLNFLVPQAAPPSSSAAP